MAEKSPHRIRFYERNPTKDFDWYLRTCRYHERTDNEKKIPISYSKDSS